jgi:hypothetical protein
MLDKSSSTESETRARLDKAVLLIVLDSRLQRPISEAEVARIVRTPGYVSTSFKRLRAAGLIHRWNDLATATHAAAYYHQITQCANPESRQERHADRTVLGSLLVRGDYGQRPLSEQDLWDVFSAGKKKQKLRITHALDRLDAAGLIERRGGQSVASEVAIAIDRLLTL